MSPKAAEVTTLTDLITSTQSLLRQFTTALRSTSNPTTIPNAPNPLHLLRDAATLLKAHTTKVSLLAINKPFTPTAITAVLRDLSTTCLPALISGAQICSTEEKTWGKLMGKEVHARVLRVFREVENLLQELRSIAEGNAPGGSRRDSLSSTGVVWESCDALVELEKMGIAGLAVRKAEQYRDAISDAIEELKEWKEGTDLESEGHDDALLDSGDEGVDGDAESLEEMFNAANSLPADRVELRELVEKAEGRLKKVVLLFTAVGKRRLKTFGGEKVDGLDRVLEQLEVVQNDVDDLAGLFYDLDEDGVKEGLEKCVREAKAVSKIVKLDWEGKEDAFTAWSAKWEEAVG
ncbi:hypothetical protein TI39_contig4189g00004 [Zymoseptoria brevis]|uniref:Cyclin-D1-binding protein 1-like N-terminal domain-containing protein n=1 Tax=Zymoseptoria brevis TaxID=1047168 RepID=A0A0F4GAR3_9PEZI|nr:hypothetical protein TI39_contig4189g00004 [Zymoseptoria brevis]